LSKAYNLRLKFVKQTKGKRLMKQRISRSVNFLSLMTLIALCFGLPVRAITVNDYVIPTPNSNPFQLVAGPDGSLWFTEARAAKIGRITPSGVITEFPLSNPFSGVMWITAGPDGNLWFTLTLSANDHRIARITPSGVITEFPLPNPSDSPYSLIAGKDALWYLVAGRKVGKVTTSGAITEFPLPVPFANAINKLTADAAGNIFFIQIRSQNPPPVPAEYFLGKLTPDGSYSETALGPLRSFYITDLALGPDAALWVSTMSGPEALGNEAWNGLRKLEPSGALSTTFVATRSLAPTKFITGPANDFWFLANVGAFTNRLGRATLDGAVTQYEAGGVTLFTELVKGPDNRLWLIDPSRNLISRLTPDSPTDAVVARAASYVGGALSPSSIAALFGASLAVNTASATTLPLPTTLAGVSLKVRDGGGVEHTAPLLFVSPTQINFIVPAEVAVGNATVAVVGSDGRVISSGTMIVDTVALGLFSADASGRGVAAALVLRVKADGSQLYEPIAQFDPAQNRFVALPIDLGTADEQVFLVLYGSGWRRNSNLADIRAHCSGGLLPVEYAGAQGSFAGLDQINLRLPRTLSVRGEQDVIITVADRPANPVRINVR
jgi:virginiamycin B lyase